MMADYLPAKLTKEQQELIEAMNRHDYVLALRIIVNAIEDFQNAPTRPGASDGGK